MLHFMGIKGVKATYNNRKQEQGENNVKNSTIKLLAETEKAAAFGRDATDSVLKRVDQPELRHELAKIRREYDEVCNLAKNSLTRLGHRSGKNPQSIKMMARTAIDAKLNRRRDPSKAAGMIIQGCTMGNVELLKALHENPSAAQYAKEIANRAIVEQERSIEVMKSYL